jgi:hypothetical protein
LRLKGKLQSKERLLKEKLLLREQSRQAKN